MHEVLPSVDGPPLPAAGESSRRRAAAAVTAGMLAFAAGALVVAVAFELFEPAHRQAGLPR